MATISFIVFLLLFSFVDVFLLSMIFCILTPIFLLLVVSFFSLSVLFDFEGFAGGSNPATKVVF